MGQRKAPRGRRGFLLSKPPLKLPLAHHQLQPYNFYQALLSSPRYADRPGKMAAATAQGGKVTRSTVYRALRIMY